MSYSQHPRSCRASVATMIKRQLIYKERLVVTKTSKSSVLYKHVYRGITESRGCCNVCLCAKKV